MKALCQESSSCQKAADLKPTKSAKISSPFQAYTALEEGYAQ